MKRQTISARPDAAKKLESQGLSFHKWDDYWKEDACYRFTLKQIEEIETATEELHQMCLQAVKVAIYQQRLTQFGIPEAFWKGIKQSWEKHDFSVYGRFDFAYDGLSPPKMLEYNADTPTSLLESAVCQWHWLEDVFPQFDQFNALHESLVRRWKQLSGNETVYLTSIKDNEEDWVCTTYMMDTVLQAGRNAQHIYLEDIGWNPDKKVFVDLEENPINTLFKLHPWEFIMHEEFGPYVLESTTRFIEPLWKSVLSCKALLPLLWELYPNHPNLLPAYFESGHLTSYARKPLFSREGANITLVKNGHIVAQDPGPYGREGYIEQGLVEMPVFDKRYPIIGSWVVDDKPAGMCIREDIQQITTNMSNFVPHYFTE